MKKRIRIKPNILIIVSTTLALIFGCSEDFFDQKAGDRITPDQHYLSIIDGEIAMYGAIMPLQDIMPKFIMYDGVRSDMMEVNSTADAYLQEINNQNINPGNPYTDPADFYKVIININEVLANVDKIVEKDRNMDEFILHSVKGALIGMRSWTYFTLVRMFGQAAYIEDNFTSLPDDMTQLMLSKSDMIDTLINQLTPYIQLGTDFIEIRFGNFVNNKAVMGELYLEKNDYANAVYYLKLACESYLDNTSVFKVDNTYKDLAWQSIFFNAENALLENFSVIPYSSIDGQFNPLANWLGHNFDYVVKPSQVLVDSFMAQVPAAGKTGDFFRGPGASIGVDTLSWLTDTTYILENFITKYEIDISDPFSSDIIISRAADIHLLLAEALNRMGDDLSQTYALMLLNSGVNAVNPKPAIYSRWSRNLGIRGRVYLTPRVVPDGVTGVAKTRMIEDFIIAERALELAFEGKRWFDLVRVAERRNQPEFLADKVAAKFDGAMYNDIRARLMNPANWYLPVE
jgi:hypothetical protein